MSSAEFVRRADVEVTNREFRGKPYRALVCRLEKGPELTLLFDETNRLRGFEERAVEGDVFPAAYRYEDPKVVPPGEWVTMWGLLEQYDQVGGHEVLVAWQRGVTTSGGIVSSGRYKRTNIREIDAPLGSKISFPDLEIENGTRVSCDGREALVYVYRDGKLYLAADSASVDAARRSRWWRGAIGSPWYYTLGLVGFLVIFALMIYLRNRNA